MPCIDIVVIGGGPGGLQAATALSQRGFRVVVLEEHGDVGEQVLCTGIIGTAAFQEFPLPQETIVGSLQQVRARGRYGTEVVYAPAQPLAYMVDKPAFNRALAQQAATAGAEIREQSRAVAICTEADHIAIQVRASAEREYTLKASLVILACGVHYRLAKQLGLGMPQEFLHGAQTEIPGTWTAETEIYLDKTLSPEAFGWVAPLETGWSRVGLMAGRDAHRTLASWLDRLLPEWRERPEIQIGSKLIAQGGLRRTYSERVLVVGEAAGQIKWTTGGGIYYALLCAQLAVQTAVEAFALRSFTATTLSRYERAWKRAIGRELQMGKYFRKLYSHLQDAQVEMLLQLAERNGLMELIHAKADFDWHYSLIEAMLKHTEVRKIALASLFSPSLG
jgi:geranylgeranyl reductase family protein